MKIDWVERWLWRSDPLIRESHRLTESGFAGHTSTTPSERGMCGEVGKQGGECMKENRFGS